MRQRPSTSTRAVPSGNFTILDKSETQPTSCKSSGAGSATSALRCNTAANSRSPATMSSTSFRLGPVSTRSGTTAPGKITMSERPRIGSASGSEREEKWDGNSDFSPVPRMLTNSVSGDGSFEFIVVSTAGEIPPRPEIHARSCSFRNGDLGGFDVLLLRGRHINAQKTVHINRLGAVQIVARRQIQHRFKRPVTDRHHQKTAMRRAAAVRPDAGDAQPLALDDDFEAVAFHAGQLDLDDEAVLADINIGVRRPAPGGGFARPVHRGLVGNKMNGGTDFGDGHDVEIVLLNFDGQRAASSFLAPASGSAQQRRPG